MPRKRHKTVEDVRPHLVASVDNLERAFTSWFLQDYVRQNSTAFEEITSEHKSYFMVNHIVWQSTHSCILSLAKIFDTSKNVKSLAKLCGVNLNSDQKLANHVAKQCHGYCDFCDRKNWVENSKVHTSIQMLPDKVYEECIRFELQQQNICKLITCWQTRVKNLRQSDELKPISDFRSTHVAHNGTLQNIELAYPKLESSIEKCSKVIADGFFFLQGQDTREKIERGRSVAKESALEFWGTFLKGLS